MLNPRRFHVLWLIDLDELDHGLVDLGTLLRQSCKDAPRWLCQNSVSILRLGLVASAVFSDALDLEASEGWLQLHLLFKLHS